MNIQKYVVFLYINNELSERDTKETIPFITASKRRKYLGINSTKGMKDHTLKSVIHYWKKFSNTNEWKDVLCSWIGRINVEMSILSKEIHWPNAIHIKIPKAFFHRNTAILKFIQTHKTLRNKNIARCIMLLLKQESVEIKTWSRNVYLLDWKYKVTYSSRFLIG